jgi:hypothetical protein
MAGLPPPPINDKPGSFTWLEWYRQLRNYVSTSGSVPWYIINFSGSNITDIALRSHENLQGLQGGAAGEHFHLTAAQASDLSTKMSEITGTWTPVFTSLTVVGSPTITGRYTRHGRIVWYNIYITGAVGVTSASTAGTTYCTLPIPATQDDTVSVTNGTTRLSVGGGYLDSTNDRLYPASWTATENKIIISGKYEV